MDLRPQETNRRRCSAPATSVGRTGEAEALVKICWHIGHVAAGLATKVRAMQSIATVRTVLLASFLCKIEICLEKKRVKSGIGEEIGRHSGGSFLVLVKHKGVTPSLRRSQRDGGTRGGVSCQPQTDAQATLAGGNQTPPANDPVGLPYRECGVIPGRPGSHFHSFTDNTPPPDQVERIS
jgi:hypothetical protein